MRRTHRAVNAVAPGQTCCHALLLAPASLPQQRDCVDRAHLQEYCPRANIALRPGGCTVRSIGEEAMAWRCPDADAGTRADKGGQYIPAIIDRDGRVVALDIDGKMPSCAAEVDFLPSGGRSQLDVSTASSGHSNVLDYVGPEPAHSHVVQRPSPAASILFPTSSMAAQSLPSKEAREDRPCRSPGMPTCRGTATRQYRIG
jgi:hypothetical protein